MLFVLSKIATILLDPLLWFFLFLGGSFLLRKKGRWKRGMAIGAWAVLLLFSNPVFLELGWRAWEYPVSRPTDLNQTYAYAVVLGGYSNPGASSEDKLVFRSDPNRLTDAVRLYKLGKVEKLVLTGGTSALSGDKASEAPLAAAFLKDIGVPAEDVLVEPHSRNTKENAANTASLLGTEVIGKKTVLLITSAFHMRRAVPTFERAGFKVTPYATDARVHDKLVPDFRAFLPDPWALAEWQFLLKEWVGYLAYKTVYSS
jgi:uncharacterized SAM-binding protein YcdF (DUF218 family)